MGKINYTNKNKGKTSFGVTVATNVLSVAISLVITIINQSLRKVVRAATLFE